MEEREGLTAGRESSIAPESIRQGLSFSTITFFTTKRNVNRCDSVAPTERLSFQEPGHLIQRYNRGNKRRWREYAVSLLLLAVVVLLMWNVYRVNELRERASKGEEALERIKAALVNVASDIQTAEHKLRVEFLRASSPAVPNPQSLSSISPMEGRMKRMETSMNRVITLLENSNGSGVGINNLTAIRSPIPSFPPQLTEAKELSEKVEAMESKIEFLLTEIINCTRARYEIIK